MSTAPMMLYFQELTAQAAQALKAKMMLKRRVLALTSLTGAVTAR
jgi:hypothetical protein